VIDGTGAPLATGRTVVVRGRTIETVAPDGEVALAGLRRIDGSGRFLIPGLVDLHAHSLADEQYHRLCLANGVTTIRDMGCSPECTEALRARRAAFRDGRGPGPRLFFTGPNLDGASPFDDPGHIRVRADAADGTVARLRSMDVDFLKVRDWLSLEEYDAVTRAARKVQLPVVGHVPAAVPILHALESGQRSIEHDGSSLGGFLLAVSAREDELRQEVLEAMREAVEARDDAAAYEETDPALVNRLLDSQDEGKAATLTKALLDSGAALVPTLFVLHPALGSSDPTFDGRRLRDDPAMHYVPEELLEAWRSGEIGKPPGGDDQRTRLFGRLLELLGRFHRAGVPILAGTDAAFDEEGRWTAPGFTLHDELVLLVQLGLSPAEAVAAATSKPARFLGVEDVGTIEDGQAADLVMLSANPLDDIRNTRTISAVVSNGEFLDRAALDSILAESRRPRSALPHPVSRSTGPRSGSP
jgi:hypothetical protein